MKRYSLLDVYNDWRIPDFNMYQLGKRINNAVLTHGKKKVLNTLSENMTPNNYKLYTKFNDVLQQFE